MAVSVVDPTLGPSSGSGSMPARYGRSRQALVDATIGLAGRVGFHRVTVAELSVLAGLGPRTFYNHFADVSDVFFEACGQIHEGLRRAVKVAYDGPVADRGEDFATTAGDGVSRGRTSACVGAVVAFVHADPLRARVLFVEGYAGGPAVADLRAETIEWLIGLVVGNDASRGARLSAEFAVGGINGVLYSRIKAGDLAHLTDLVPSFVDTLTRARGGTGDLRGR